MSQMNIAKLRPDGHDEFLGKYFDWHEIRRCMLTSNEEVGSDNPASCIEMFTLPHQAQHIQNCIKSLYRALRFADFLNIRGGYTGERNHNRSFFIDDQNIAGIFDDRNLTPINNFESNKFPQTFDELINLYRSSKNNIKTIIVFEKSNNRLAASYERCCQSRFLIEVIYPAFAAIAEVAAQTNQVIDEGPLPNQLDLWPLDKLEHVSSSSFSEPKIFKELFNNPKKVDEILFGEPLLELLFGKKSFLSVGEDTEKYEHIGMQERLQSHVSVLRRIA